jgi:hypothetical protein
MPAFVAWLLLPPPAAALRCVASYNISDAFGLDSGGEPAAGGVPMWAASSSTTEIVRY